MLPTQRHEPVFGSLIERGKLNLHAEERYPSRDNGLDMGRVEIGSADEIDLALAAQLVEPPESIDESRHFIVPPVELDEIEAVRSQTHQRLIDDRTYVIPGEARQLFEIGDEFGVNLDSTNSVGTAPVGKSGTKSANQFLNAGIDICAIIGENAGIIECDEIVYGFQPVNRPMAASKLPSAADHPRYRVARP